MTSSLKGHLSLQFRQLIILILVLLCWLPSSWHSDRSSRSCRCRLQELFLQLSSFEFFELCLQFILWKETGEKYSLGRKNKLLETADIPHQNQLLHQWVLPELLESASYFQSARLFHPLSCPRHQYFCNRKKSVKNEETESSINQYIFFFSLTSLTSSFL